ncbi:hypothetical protein ACVWXM_000328 [Bradyrhizobium sp. GM7.3]
MAPRRGQLAVADAVAASGIADATRVRLIQRSDGPVYVVSGPSRAGAVRASDGAGASVASSDVALAIARDHARSRGLDAARAAILARADYDQWSVPNGFDRHRPLFRVALGDAAGTEVYVSSLTGEIVLDTTRSERTWNLVGSVLHWIYPTILRSNWSLWDRVVWTLSLLALIACLAGRCARPCADQTSKRSDRLALSRLACAASSHRPRGDGVRADLDFQRLALHGSRAAVLARAMGLR